MSRTSRVMAIAYTPSLNASSRPVLSARRGAPPGGCSSLIARL